MEQFSVNLHVFARRQDEANSGTEREIASAEKHRLANDTPISFIVIQDQVNSWRTFHKSASAKSDKQNHPFLNFLKG